MSEERALAALEAAGVDYEITRHGKVGSLAEAAALRGVAPDRIVKTLVVRRSADDYVLVLVPGDRQIDWPKLRRHLGVSRLSLPPAEEAFAATGYERGTITPFSTTRRWPVIADSRVSGTISLGAGAQGVAVTVDADRVIDAVDAAVADVTA